MIPPAVDRDRLVAGIRFEIELRLTELGRVTAEAQEITGALRALIGQLDQVTRDTSPTATQ